MFTNYASTERGGYSIHEMPLNEQPPLQLLSVIIPARDEARCIAATVEHLHVELRLNNVPHEIIVIDDGSSDNTWNVLQETQKRVETLRPLQNLEAHGFGRAVVLGFDHAKGDALVIMMADESDDCRDVVRYWEVLNSGYDCVFGSRFVKGGGVVDYPWLKLWINRCANLFIRFLFRIKPNDTTNAFKAYRREVIAGCRPFLSPHFNLTVEIPLKAIVRGYSWTVIPITWRNRRTGGAKLKSRKWAAATFSSASTCGWRNILAKATIKKNPVKSLKLEPSFWFLTRYWNPRMLPCAQTATATATMRPCYFLKCSS